MTLEEWKLARTAMLLAVEDMDAVLPVLKALIKLLDSRTDLTREYVDYLNKRDDEGDLPTDLHEVVQLFVEQHESHYAAISILLLAVARTMSIPLPRDHNK